MTAEVWTFAGLVVTSLGGILAAAAALVAAVRSGHAKDHAAAAEGSAAEAATAAGQARDYSEPTASGYAKETTSALARIEARLERIDDRQRLTDTSLVRHLADHARSDITHHEETPR